jgi:hypothetical protein
MPPKEAHKIHLWGGVCFRHDKETEVESLLGMQSMTATVASLMAGTAAGMQNRFFVLFLDAFTFY